VSPGSFGIAITAGQQSSIVFLGRLSSRPTIQILKPRFGGFFNGEIEVLVPNDSGLPPAETGGEAQDSDAAGAAQPHPAADEINPTVQQCSPPTQVGGFAPSALRQYQVDVVDRIEALLGTAARPLIVAPTGSGKTIIAAETINRHVARGGRVLVIAHRREIIR